MNATDQDKCPAPTSAVEREDAAVDRLHPPRALALSSLSIDARLLHRLATGGFEGRVHSVFEQVVNVEDASGGLLALSSRKLGDAPDTVVVDAAGFGAFGIAVGESVVLVRGKLRLGDRLVLTLGSARHWDAALPDYPTSDSLLRTNLRLVAAHRDRHGRSGGVLASTHGASGVSPFADQVAATLERHSALLLNALARGDCGSARAHGEAMVGLGPGLTPSGDDFLVGLFAVLNIPGSPCHRWRGVCGEILSSAGSATNAISLAALANAAQGRVRASIGALAQQLMFGRGDGLIVAANRVLAIGSTSGTDVLTGMLSGFELNLRVG